MIGAVVLAAGGSKRLGYPKQEIIYKGQPMLVNAVNSVRAAFNGPVLVVLGAEAPRIQQLLSPMLGPGLQTVVNTDWSRGMGSSIACGVQALATGGEQLDGVLISLCDQPFLTSGMIRKLIARAEQFPERIVGSGYAGTIGPPVIFPAAFFPMLRNCSGKAGARHILKEHAEHLDSIELPELSFDIDTPEEHKFIL